MTKNIDKLSRQLAKALDQVAVAAIRAPKMDPADIIAKLDEIETAFLAKLVGHPDLVIETKRRVAEQKFKLLSKRSMLFEDIIVLYYNIRELGFADLEREATLEIIFARYCLRHNHPDQAKAVLEKLCSKLDETLRTDDRKSYRRDKKTADTLLKSIMGS